MITTAFLTFLLAPLNFIVVLMPDFDPPSFSDNCLDGIGAKCMATMVGQKAGIAHKWIDLHTLVTCIEVVGGLMLIVAGIHVATFIYDKIPAKST